MSYLHLTSTANSSTSSTPSSYLHVNSNGAVSTVSSTLNSNSSSLFGTVGGGKQWTTIGQTPPPSSSSSSSSSTTTTITQQLLKQQQQQLLNNQQNSLLNSSSSQFDTILGLTMASALASSTQTQMEKNFELQQEDFPPLPHRSNSHEPTSSSTNNIQPLYQTQYSTSSIPNGYNSSQQQQQQQHSQSQSPVLFKNTSDMLSNIISRHQAANNNNKIPTTPSNNSQSISNSVTSTNINGLPSSTITDQYGLVGLLQTIQQAEKNPESSSVLNYDLTTLGLSMESSNELYPSFLSPFSDNQARPYEIDYQVPLEYQMGMQIRDKLPPLNFNTLNEDTVFFLFYLFGNDQVQLLSAAELYRRDWRYHKEERLWLTRIKNVMPDHKFDTYETGVYCVFDVQLWRKIHKGMRIDYDKLDVNPAAKQQDIIASKLFQHQSSVQQQQQSYTPGSSYTNNSSR